MQLQQSVYCGKAICACHQAAHKCGMCRTDADILSCAARECSRRKGCGAVSVGLFKDTKVTAYVGAGTQRCRFADVRKNKCGRAERSLRQSGLEDGLRREAQRKNAWTRQRRGAMVRKRSWRREKNEWGRRLQTSERAGGKGRGGGHSNFSSAAAAAVVVGVERGTNV